MKKILYVITKSNWGGAQKYVFDLATNVDKTQFDVAVAFGEGGTLEEKLKASGIRTIKIDGLARDINPLTDLRTFKVLLQEFKREKPDIVHLNSSKIGGIGALAGRLAHVPNIIFTVHGWAFNEKRGAIKTALIWIASWATALLSTHIIVLSEREKRQTHAMPFVSSKKVVVIRNGVRDINFEEQAAARNELMAMAKSKGTWNDQSGDFWIGTLAELHPNKGLDFLIGALPAISENVGSLHCFVLGEGEERERLEKIIKENGLTGRVHLVGQVVDAAKYIKAFNVFTVTSHKEGLPYALLEAGAAGVTVVATEVGGIPDIIEDMVSGMLIKPGQSSEIAKAVTFITEHPHDSNAWARKLHEEVLKKYSLETMREKTVSLYKENL